MGAQNLIYIMGLSWKGPPSSSPDAEFQVSIVVQIKERKRGERPRTRTRPLTFRRRGACQPRATPTLDPLTQLPGQGRRHPVGINSKEPARYEQNLQFATEKRILTRGRKWKLFKKRYTLCKFWGLCNFLSTKCLSKKTGRG